MIKGSKYTYVNSLSKTLIEYFLNKKKISQAHDSQLLGYCVASPPKSGSNKIVLNRKLQIHIEKRLKKESMGTKPLGGELRKTTFSFGIFLHISIPLNIYRAISFISPPW